MVMEIIWFLKDVLFYIGLTGSLFSLVFLVVGLMDWLKLRSMKKCSAAALGVIKAKRIIKGRDEGISTFDVEFENNGEKIWTRIPLDLVEGINVDIEIGTEVPIYYDPKKPTHAFISEDPQLRKTKKFERSFNKWVFIFMVFSIGLMIYSLMIPNLTATTVRKFDEGYSAFENEKPLRLRYSQSLAGAETLKIETDDETLVKATLAALLAAKVAPWGEYVDMYVQDYQDYCFIFASGEHSFRFAGDSYFSYDGRYYELKGVDLAKLRSAIYACGNYEVDDGRLKIDFIDNGDEAHSLLEVTLLIGDEYLSASIEGAYEVLDIKTVDDGYLITYNYGDYYGHSTVRSTLVTTMDGELMIMDL